MAKSSRTVARLREAQSLELALGGASWDEVAALLGYSSRSGAWRAAQRGLARRTVSAANDYFDAMLVEAECIREKYWPAAMRGDIAAAEVVLRAMDRAWSLMSSPGRPASSGSPSESGAPSGTPPQPSMHRPASVRADWDSGVFTWL